MFSGSLADYEADRLGFLIACRDRYGGLVSFDRRTTIVNDPQLARDVLRRHDAFQIREDFLQQRLDDRGVDDAFEMRRLLNPALRRARVPSVVPIVRDVTRETITRTLSEPSRPAGPTSWNPLPALEQVTSKAIAAYLFGADGSVLPGPVGELLDALSAVIGNPFALPASWPTPARRRIGRSHARVRTLVLPMLEDRLDVRATRADAATEVCRAARGASGVSTSSLADLLIGAMLAAHRVPAGAAAWALMLLADHSSIQDSLLDEAQRFEQDLSASTWLSADHYPRALALVLETLRLYPVTWVLGRRVSRPSWLGGFRLEAGHNVLISPYVIHRDEQNFVDAHAFAPERWLGPERPGGVFLPFGHGVHGCPGNDVATSVVVAIVLTVVGRWTVRREPTDVRADPRTTLLPIGLNLDLRARATGAVSGRRASGGGVLAVLGGRCAESLPGRLP